MYENKNTVRHYEHGWRSMKTRVNGQESLPGFALDVEMIEEAISQQDSCSSSKCDETFSVWHIFLKHCQKEHALKRRTQTNALINRL
ncbi:8102_t:CDS:2 [Funneliformis mosseae]|uniref:8102_t:CDS:1 n=1 Tax=Funneliformis mosseae TaxID=27381 RepID=A0A9N9E5G0_FUNMO|nr:8102_t:CDS:2 [Funneliformis mosseae]